ncbi:hypothetical protein SAMN02745225_00214 [Ferrithrix thermotolerans DSM 19514]|uniref:Uncharacterized protein n=1 Tax=Ferrithrix thermotolerans DSM 19514 TaxID=1121881 RepID=A0A1M4SCX4_9ACTN|nr:hypothetical protein SAMN02745225_00214 [Ferrithrix thermotolerans DSM 19514]
MYLSRPEPTKLTTKACRGEAVMREISDNYRDEELNFILGSGIRA